MTMLYLHFDVAPLLFQNERLGSKKVKNNKSNLWDEVSDKSWPECNWRERAQSSRADKSLQLNRTAKAKPMRGGEQGSVMVEPAWVIL